MKSSIKSFSQEFLRKIENNKVRVISHYDSDGITSAAIISKMLKRLNKKFSVRIVKNLEKEIIEEESKRNSNEILLFTDLASNSLDYLNSLNRDVFIIDHHEIKKEKISSHIKILNPHLFDKEDICAAALCYFVSKEVSLKNKDLSKLAIIGMIGDRHEKEISREYQEIISDCEDLELKKSLLIFSATRPIKKALEYSTSFFIPGITGSSEGVLEFLKENNISPEKSLYDLTEKEVSRIITSLAMRRGMENFYDEMIGNIFIINFFNRKEDARELSALINSCSRLGSPDIAFSFCLESENYYEIAQEMYIKYRKELLDGLKSLNEVEKIEGNGFVIINGKEKIKDAIIGTICSILSSSKTYDSGTILIGMAYNEDKIKVSARIVGESEKNLKEVLEKVVIKVNGEVGGHKEAAGCLIKKEYEKIFIEELRKNLEIEKLSF
ncbi:MAG: DHH family phosphoesterase [Candidatus Pacearchaeota archaeon]